MKHKYLWLVLALVFASLVPVSLVPSAQAAVTLNDYYATGDDFGYFLHPNSGNWMGQTFTTSVAYYVTVISLKGWSLSSQVGTLTVSLRATIGDVPTGSDLTSGTLNLATANDTNPGSWHNITMTTSTSLAANTKYAIIGHVTGSNDWIWREDATTPTYSGGSRVDSIDFGSSWIAQTPYDFMFRVYGQLGYNFNFKGVFYEESGLLKPPSQRNATVTAHFSDSSLNENFKVNGSYTYVTIHQVLYFSFNISQVTTEWITSQYGFNMLVYNQSASYTIWLPQTEVDTAYYPYVTTSWNTTYAVTAQTALYFTVTFNTKPNQASNYLNWYIYRTRLTALTKEREYWISPNEQYGSTIYIFDGDFTTYTVNFLDLAGVLATYPWVAAKRYVNGTLMTVEKRKVDVENKMLMNLINGKKYTLTVEGTNFAYTYGELTVNSKTSITLTIRGIDFPKETLLTYKYVRVSGLRAFATPTGSITITYQDLLNMTGNVVIDIDYKNGTNVYSSTQNASSFILSWLSAANNTDYEVTATISHQRYGIYSWKQYFPRTYSTNPWVLGWLGSIEINVNYLIGIFIVIVVGASFSMLNPAIGAFLATCVAAALTVMGWLPLAPGILLAAFCFSIMFGLVWAKRRVTYG